MEFGFATNLISCIIGGFGIAWAVWIIAAAITWMVNMFAGRRSTRNM